MITERFWKKVEASGGGPDSPTYCGNPGAPMCLLCSSLAGPREDCRGWLESIYKLGGRTYISAVIIPAKCCPGLKIRVEWNQQRLPQLQVGALVSFQARDTELALEICPVLPPG